MIYDSDSIHNKYNSSRISWFMTQTPSTINIIHLRYRDLWLRLHLPQNKINIIRLRSSDSKPFGFEFSEQDRKLIDFLFRIKKLKEKHVLIQMAANVLIHTYIHIHTYVRTYQSYRFDENVELTNREVRFYDIENRHLKEV